jgi:hypothetical protein
MATPNIVPRADQEGGLGTSAKSWGKLFIENPTAGGTAAATISNLDVDQIALDINANNTTANIIDISTSALTTGSALNFDVTDTLTGTATANIIEIDYDKSGIVTASNVRTVRGIDINLADSATNNGSGFVQLVGQKITLNNTNDTGTIIHTGLEISATGGDAAQTHGIVITTIDGGTDLSIRSSADSGDRFTIATTAAGATTISTIDDDATNANLTFDLDGDLKIDNAGGDTFFYTNGNTDDYLRLTIGANGGASFATIDAAGTDADISFAADGKTKALIGSGLTTKTFTVQTTTASNPAFEFFGEDGVNSKLRIYEKAGATTDDYCEIKVEDRGATTISTVDGAGSEAAILQLSPDGDLFLTAVTGFQASDVVRQVKMGLGYTMIVAEVDVFDANTTDNGVIKQIGTVKIPQYAVIHRAHLIVAELSNLGTYNISLSIATNSGVSQGTAPANVHEIIGSDSGNSSATDSVNSTVDIELGSGSGNEKKVWKNVKRNDAVNSNGELTDDHYLYILSSGTGNGTTDGTSGRVLVYVEYFGLD